MAFGHISRLQIDRGFGFILEDDQSEEIEFHWTAAPAGLDELRIGQRVQFEVQRDQRSEGRRRAVNIRLFGGSA